MRGPLPLHERMRRMLDDVRPGVRGQAEWMVQDQHSVRHGGSQVFSTPSLVLLVEIAASNTLRPFLEPHQSSVGTRVDVRHLAATPIGMRVRAEATVEAVDRRRVSFHVDVFDDFEKIGEANHERFVIDLDRYSGRLDEKLRHVQVQSGEPDESN